MRGVVLCHRYCYCCDTRVQAANDFMPENTGFYDLSAQTWTPTMDDNTHEYVISVHPVVSNTAASFWKTYKKWAAGGASVKTVNVLTAIVLVDVRMGWSSVACLPRGSRRAPNT